MKRMVVCGLIECVMTKKRIGSLRVIVFAKKWCFWIYEKKMGKS